MTKIYFVRHAEPIHSWEEDRTRPLTEDGRRDSRQVVTVLQNIALDYCISSPYQRCIDTIKECAELHALTIHTDIRFRERVNGGSNHKEMIQKRWADFDFHEVNGESLHMVQKRNLEGLFQLLKEHEGENILFGTHGTALSMILNYYDPCFQFDDFWRIIDMMPYIVCLTFEGIKCVHKEELLMVHKEFTGQRK